MAKTDERDSHITKSEDKIPLKEKATFGTGAMAFLTTQNMVEYQIQQVLVFGMGMSPITKSIMVMIFRIWDALIDPVMGWISDSTRSKWGRRRPYMFAGTLLMAVLMPLVWRFSEDWDMNWIAVWVTGFGILVSTATTIFNIPYQALKQEMTPDYQERVSLNIYITFVTRIFALVAPWIWTMTQLPFFTGQSPDEEPFTLYGVRGLTLLCAGLVIIFGMIPTFLCKERYYKVAKKQKREPFFKNVKMTFQSKPFLMIVSFVFLVSIEGLVFHLGAYLTTYYVWGGDLVKAATFNGITGTAGAVLGFLSLPVFSFSAKKYGKHKTLLFVFIGQACMALSIPFVYTPELPWLSAIPGALNGFLMAGYWLMVPPMNADVIDEDELRNGERREGSFESVFWMLFKFSGTLFVGLSGFLVVWVGFDIELKTEQADGVFQNIMWMMFAVPFILSVIEAIIITRWPLTEHRMAEIRNELEARRGTVNANPA